MSYSTFVTSLEETCQLEEDTMEEIWEEGAHLQYVTKDYQVEVTW